MSSRFFLGEEEGVPATTAVASCALPFSELCFGRQQVGWLVGWYSDSIELLLRHGSQTRFLGPSSPRPLHSQELLTTIKKKLPTPPPSILESPTRGGGGGIHVLLALIVNL